MIRNLIVVLILNSPIALAGESSLSDVFTVLDQAIQPIQKLALIRPEATGTTESLSGVEEQLMAHFSSKQNLVVIGPDEVLGAVGAEFSITPEGIRAVATKLQAQAALFVQVVKAENQYELNLLLVNQEGNVLLDKAFSLATLPPGKESPPNALPPEKNFTSESPAEADLSEQTESQEASEAPADESSPIEIFNRRRLALAPRTRVFVGASIGFAGPHVAVGIHNPAMVAEDWMIVEGDQPIPELKLAQLSGNEGLTKKIEADIHSLITMRNVGIGLTLGGFVAAGVAFPFFKEGSTEGLSAASVFVGIGTAAGISGMILWLIYGPAAATAESPFPARHFLSKEEAEQMIDSYNDTLRRELDLHEGSTQGQTSEGPTQFQFVLAPDPQGGASVRFGFRF